MARQKDLKMIVYIYIWWCHGIDTLSVLLALCARREIGQSPMSSPQKETVTGRFNALFDISLYRRLNKQLIRRWKGDALMAIMTSS